MAFLPWAFAIHINTFTSQYTLVCKFSCWKVPTLLSYFSVLPYHLTGIYLCQKPLSKLIFDLWRKKVELPMFFLALRRKYIFSTILAVLITSLTNTITIVYVAEAYHKIHSTCVAVFPAAQMQGVEVQGRTGTFQWIFVHNLLSAFFTGGVDHAQKWHSNVFVAPEVCITLKSEVSPHHSDPIFFQNAFNGLNSFTKVEASCEIH